jgi:hypothetical protein
MFCTKIMDLGDYTMVKEQGRNKEQGTRNKEMRNKEQGTRNEYGRVSGLKFNSKLN